MGALSETKQREPITSRWDEAVAATLSEPELLLYRSNLLGSDLRITNFGGGNTSAKIDMVDPLSGEQVEVLWVKGSGGDLGSIKLDGFSTLYMSKLHALKARYRGLEHEDEMVGYLPHCTFNLPPRAGSIDTPRHPTTRTPPPASRAPPARPATNSPRRSSRASWVGCRGSVPATTWA